MVVAVEIENHRSQIITRAAEGSVEPKVPTHETNLMLFQCLHHISNLFRPRVIGWPQEWHTSGISEPKSETKKLVPEEMLWRPGALRPPLGFLVQGRLEKDGASGGKVEIGLPSRLRNERLQDRQDYDRRPQHWRKNSLDRNERTCKPDEKNNSRQGNCIQPVVRWGRSDCEKQR